MKKIVLLYFLLFSVHLTEARMDLDSVYVKSLISEGLKICLFYPDSAQKIGEQVLELSKAADQPIWQAEAHFLIGQCNIQKTNYDAAIQSLTNALNLFGQANFYRGNVKTLFALRQLAFQQGNLPLAIRYAEQAVEILKSREPQRSRVAIGLRFLSDTYLSAQQFEAAGETLTEAIALLEGTQDSIELAKLLMRKAGLEGRHSQVELVLPLIDRASRIFEASNSDREKIEGLSNLAGLSYSLGYLERARSFFEEALDIQTESGMLSGHCRILNNYAAVVSELEGVGAAIALFEEALACAQQFEDLHQANTLKRTLSSSYYKTGNFQKAYDYLDAFQQMQDSLQQQEYQEQLSRLSAEYEAEKQASAIKSLEIDNFKRTRERNFLFVGGLIVLALLGYVFSLSWIRRNAYKKVKKEKEQTDQLLLEKEALLGQLKSAQAQIVDSEKMASLGQLTAGIAHEINNPVNFVNGNAKALEIDFKEIKPLLDYIDNLKAQGDDKKKMEAILHQKESVDMAFLLTEMEQLIGGIQRGSRRIKSIVDSLRLFSHQSEDRAGLAKVNEMLDLTLTILKGKLKEKQINVEVKYEDLPEVSCQAGRVSQVFMNIIDNAIDAMPSGGQLTVQTTRQTDQVCIRIGDTGPGIPPEILEKIFDPFFTTKEAGKGTGLGLAISYGIIKEHRGEIQVASEAGKGSVFTITLPIEAK